MAANDGAGTGRAGRVLMALATLLYGVLPLLVDLTSTHVFHPDWPAHARMHMVWLLGTNLALALLALRCLGRGDRSAVHLAGTLGLCVFAGFWLSAATAPLYGGALHDPGGVPPVAGVDANAVVFAAALLLLLAGWRLAVRRGVAGVR